MRPIMAILVIAILSCSVMCESGITHGFKDVIKSEPKDYATRDTKYLHTIDEFKANELKNVFWLCSDNITQPGTTYLDVINHTCEASPTTWLTMKADINETHTSPDTAVVFRFPRLEGEPGVTGAPDTSITPYINLTVCSLNTPGKVLNFKILFDYDGDGVPEKTADFDNFTTVLGAVGHHEEEFIELEAKNWFPGDLQSMTNGKITLLIWRTDNVRDDDNPTTPDLIVYCGFDHTSDTFPKQSWIAVPYEHYLIHPVAKAGPDINGNGIHDGCEGDNLLEANYSVTFDGYMSYDPQDDVGQDGVAESGDTEYGENNENIDDGYPEGEPDYGETDSLTYKWYFGDGSSATGRKVTHAYEHEGTYTVRLEVRDPEWHYDVDFLTVYISPYTGVPPKINKVTITTCPAVTDEDITGNEILAAEPAERLWKGEDAVGLVDYEVMLVSTASDDDEDDILRYTWDFGDGTPPTEPLTAGEGGGQVRHTYTTPGNYTVQLIVYDDVLDDPLLHWARWEAILTIKPNEAPIAKIRARVSGGEWEYDNITVILFQEVEFDASKSFDRDLMPGFAEDKFLEFRWDFDGDDEFDTNWLSEANRTWRYATPGVNYRYEPLLQVRDGEDGSLSGTCTFIVNINVKPKAVAKVSYPPEDVELVVGDTVRFDGSESTDPNGDVLTYYWNFGDGTNATGIEVEHVYSVPGEYTVSLTVSDGVLMDSTTCVVEVLPVNQLPIANIVADVDEEYTDVPITFIGVNSTDVDGWLVAFYWDFGDNTTANVTIEDGLLIKNQTHSYKRTGTYKIRLTVVDNRGGTAETMIEIYIKNRLPIADAGSDQTVNYEDQPVDFDGRASQDPEGTMLNYTWMIELPDGALIFLYGDTPSYFFEQPGEYEVILTVTDEDGGVDEDTVKIIIKKVTKPSGRPTGGFLYGFELIALIIAICICILVAASSSWSKRRK